MKALLQRVSEASVTTQTGCVGKITTGLLIFLCVEPDDSEKEVAFLAEKVTNLRIFADADGKMNLSVRDTGGRILAVSQFTLAAHWRKGNRPGFSAAAAPDLANSLYDAFCEAIRSHGIIVETGSFGEHMDVALINDGPVTLWLDTNHPI